MVHRKQLQTLLTEKKLKKTSQRALIWGASTLCAQPVCQNSKAAHRRRQSCVDVVSASCARTGIYRDIAVAIGRAYAATQSPA